MAMAYSFRESIREGLPLSKPRRLYPEGTMLPLLFDRFRKRCYNLWTDLGEKANVGPYLAARHLWNVSVSDVINGRSKEPRTCQLVYPGCQFLHSNW
jgi:hypothetical protein